MYRLVITCGWLILILLAGCDSICEFDSSCDDDDSGAVALSIAVTSWSQEPDPGGDGWLNPVVRYDVTNPSPLDVVEYAVSFEFADQTGVFASGTDRGWDLAAHSTVSDRYTFWTHRQLVDVTAVNPGRGLDRTLTGCGAEAQLIEWTQNGNEPGAPVTLNYELIPRGDQTPLEVGVDFSVDVEPSGTVTASDSILSPPGQSTQIEAEVDPGPYVVSDVLVDNTASNCN